MFTVTHTLVHPYTLPGEQSPITLERVTLNYLNYQTESAKKKKDLRVELGATRILNVPEEGKDHPLKHFSLAYPNTDKHMHTHTKLASVFTLDTVGKKTTVWGQMAVGGSTWRRHILRCYLHKREDYLC